MFLSAKLKHPRARDLDCHRLPTAVPTAPTQRAVGRLPLALATPVPSGRGTPCPQVVLRKALKLSRGLMPRRSLGGRGCMLCT